MSIDCHPPLSILSGGIMSQTEKILHALELHPAGLTTRELSDVSDSTNVTGRIAELRVRGYKILNLKDAIIRGSEKYNAWILYRG
jgi:hypothetical protein